MREIYGLFLQGRSPYQIAKTLTEKGIPTPGGKKVWGKAVVESILTNEKYKGDALMQKVYTVNFLSKKKKVNEGEVPQYYVEGNHEAIISPVVFDMVQAELEQRKRSKGSRYSGVSIFSSKIKCGDCGGWYGSKVWHSTDKYRKVIYRCNRKYGGGQCMTPHVTEDGIKELFIKACNKLLSEKKEIIANTELMRTALCATSELAAERDRLWEEMTVLVEMIQTKVAENARVAQNQEEYQRQYDGLVERYETAKGQYDETVYAMEQKDAQNEKMRRFIETLKGHDGIITEFDEELWGILADFVTIGRKGCSVTFKDGTEITI